MNSTLTFWLDWLFTPACALCDRPTATGEGCFCKNCAVQLATYRTGPWLRVEGKSAPIVPIYCWGPYAGLLRQVLRAFKYDNHPEVGETLGRWLGERWLQTQPRQTVAVIPIPLHRDRRQTRGFNQAELLSRAFCAVTGNVHRPRLLQRLRDTAPQFGLSASERQRNLQAAFTAQPPPPHLRQRSVLLIDDIYTTGTTLASAQQALVSQGWQVQAAVVVAGAEPQR